MGAAIALSVAPHVTQLGFYSDDWGFLARFSSTDGSFSALFRALHEITRPRPGEALYDAVLYWLFGLEPLGYHLVNATVIVLTGLLLYRVLQALGQPRAVSLAVPALYAVLPHYSTNRVWYASFRAGLSILLYLISLLAAIRSLDTSGRRKAVWGGISLLGLLWSGLCYEAAVPVFILNAVLCARRGGRTLAALTLLAVGAVVGFKLATSNRLASGVSGVWVLYVIKESLDINTWVYGLALPRTLWRAVKVVQPVDAVVAALLLGVAYWMIRRAGDWATGLAADVGRRLLIWGLAVTVLGHMIFLSTRDVRFSPTADGNRYAIAWAGGITLIVVGLAARVSDRAGRGKGVRVFAGLMALCVAGAFVISARLIAPWVAAYQEEQRVLGTIRQAFPTLPDGKTILLDGECTYIETAMVFSSEFDLRGALWLLYRDSTVRADVVTRWLKDAPDGLHTHNEVYPYGGLTIFDIRRRRPHRITDQAAARAYFAEFNPDRSSGCPRAEMSEGAPVF